LGYLSEKEKKKKDLKLQQRSRVNIKTHGLDSLGYHCIEEYLAVWLLLSLKPQLQPIVYFLREEI
jgi:hypothetical protein